jgi:hypothetical protein
MGAESARDWHCSGNGRRNRAGDTGRHGNATQGAIGIGSQIRSNPYRARCASMNVSMASVGGRAPPRMIDEHTYWVSVIQPRWRETANWEKYLRIIAGSDDVPPGLRAFADDFRFRILNEFMNGGWGRMPADVIYRRARTDIDALSGFLGEKRYFMGDKPRWIDAPVLSILRHIVDTPFVFDTKDYASSKKNLVSYMVRMKERFGI